MKTYATLLVEVQDRVNRQRQIERIVARTDFVEAYERADEAYRSKVEALIVACDREGVVRWMREPKGHGERSLRELRRMGQRLGVPRYNNLPKDQLLSEIARVRPKQEAVEEHHVLAVGNA